jgi:endonuclease III
MKNTETEKLKKILKPIVEECIREAIFQEGVLSTLVAEIVSGMGTAPITERKEDPTPPRYDNSTTQRVMNESKQKILEAIGESGFTNLKGVNIFEGTEPLGTSGKVGVSPSSSPLANVDPKDEGLNIDSLVGLFGNKWNALK